MSRFDLETRMKAGEKYHDLQVPTDHYAVLRVDGRGFSRFTLKNFEKPFDRRFCDLMLETAQALLVDFGASYAYIESDEISLLLPLSFANFGREVEKLVSLSAACASAHFTLATGEIAHFDARVWQGETPQDVADYFRWRQSDATRCALNGWCYWMLRNEGKSQRAATKVMNGLGSDAKKALLLEREVDFAALPSWQRRGVGMFWESYEKTGIDPQKGEVNVTRRRIATNEDLPAGEAYESWIQQHFLPTP